MDEGQGHAGQGMTQDSDNRTPEVVRAEIERTRAGLGDTVEALAAKADIKAQAERAVSDARTTASEKAVEVRQAVSGRRDRALSAAPGSAAQAGREVASRIRENRARLIPALALMLGVAIRRRRTR